MLNTVSRAVGGAVGKQSVAEADKNVGKRLGQLPAQI
jgi:hypothetical protein